MFIDYYEILEISPNANAETMERIFRYLALRYHPDNPNTGDPARFFFFHNIRRLGSENPVAGSLALSRTFIAICRLPTQHLASEGLARPYQSNAAVCCQIGLSWRGFGSRCVIRPAACAIVSTTWPSRSRGHSA